MGMTPRPTDMRALIVVALLGLCACGDGAPAAHVTSPTPTRDAAMRAYVLLIHEYWIDLVAADGNAPTVCYEGPINPAECKARAEAQLDVQQKFLSDLQAIQPPAELMQANAVLLHNIPMAIAGLKAMITASSSGDMTAVVQATTTYIGVMRGTIEGALDQIDPAVNHQR
jgi:hypothetical protein